MSITLSNLNELGAINEDNFQEIFESIEKIN